MGGHSYVTTSQPDARSLTALGGILWDSCRHPVGRRARLQLRGDVRTGWREARREAEQHLATACALAHFEFCERPTANTNIAVGAAEPHGERSVLATLHGCCLVSHMWASKNQRSDSGATDTSQPMPEKVSESEPVTGHA